MAAAKESFQVPARRRFIRRLRSVRIRVAGRFPRGWRFSSPLCQPWHLSQGTAPGPPFSMDPDHEHHTRTIVVEGKPVTIYSLDGLRWSSNKQDLKEWDRKRRQIHKSLHSSRSATVPMKRFK